MSWQPDFTFLPHPTHLNSQTLHEMAESKIHTYHCICCELVLATFAPLTNLPKRKGDGSAICKVTNSDLPVPGGVVLSGSAFEKDDPVILKLEDGFEKRYPLQCRRCALQIGYYLDKSQFGETESGVRSDVLYTLPGGLISTEEMKAGRVAEDRIGMQVKEVG